jgi:hypothetical protein
LLAPGALPHKGASGLFFAAVGLGFMTYEICMIQKLTLLLGHPTDSLTVTLMSLLVFTGLGALATGRYRARRNAALPGLVAVLALLTVFYRLGLDALVGVALATPLGLRVALAMLCTAPLGLVLGAFMPLGLFTLARLSDHGDEYVAWGWATNGFFSVVGSVSTTILAMSVGFADTLLAGFVAYLVASLALRSLPQPTAAPRPAPSRGQ